MIALGRKKYLPIGLQLSDGTATAVQLTGRPGNYEIHAMAHSELPYDESASPTQRDREIAAGLRQLLADHRFHGRQAVSCIGSQELFVQNVRLPQLPENEVEKVVRWEAEERLPYPVEEAEVRHLVAGRIRQDSNIRQEVILLACHHGTLTRHVSLLEQAGLTPQAIDIEPVALLRCLQAAGPTSPGMPAAAEAPERVACLNFAERSTTVVFAEGGQMLFLKYIATGGHHLDQAVARHLNLTLDEATRLRARVTTAPELDPANEVHRSVADAIRGPLETLSSEIELCFRYYKVTFRGRELNRLAVTGPESCSWLAAWLGERLGITAELVNPFSTLNRWPTSQSAVERPWRWTAPFGLSLRGENTQRSGVLHRYSSRNERAGPAGRLSRWRTDDNLPRKRAATGGESVMVPDVNFLPASYRRQREKKLRRLWHRGVLAVFLVLILAGTMQQRRTVGSRRQQLSSLSVRAASLRAQLPDQAALDLQQQASDDRAGLLALLQQGERPTRILMALHTSLPRFVSLGSVRFSREKRTETRARTKPASRAAPSAETPPASPAAADFLELRQLREQSVLQVHVEGQAPSDHAIARLLQSLEATGLFRTSRLLFSGGEKNDGREVRRFALVLEVRRPQSGEAEPEEAPAGQLAQLAGPRVAATGETALKARPMGPASSAAGSAGGPTP